MKKILSTLIGVVLIFSSIGACAISINEIKEDEIDRIIFDDDELDQFQTEFDGVEGVGNDQGLQISCCQSFTPQKEILTRVFLYAAKDGAPYVFQLAIRSELNGENLATVSVGYTAFPTSGLDWVEFDFEDISVTVGETYYIIMSTPKRVGHFYIVGACKHNKYPHGSCYVKINEEEWVNAEEWDFCFKTYGRNHPLHVTAKGGLGKVGARLMNNFGYDLENVQWTINVQGGLLNRISEETDGVIDVLEDSKQISISIDGFIFGLGPIEVTVSVDLETSEKIVRSSNGFVILFFISI